MRKWRSPSLPATIATSRRKICRPGCYEIYRHLGDWLLGKSEFDIKERYLEIGERRAEQHVPLSQVVWVIVLTKENLWDYLKQEAGMERPTEVFGELEMLQLLDQFFDRAIFYASMGYEQARMKESTAIHQNNF